MKSTMLLLLSTLATNALQAHPMGSGAWFYHAHSSLRPDSTALERLQLTRMRAAIP